MKRLHKVEQIGLICSFLLISSASLAQTQPKPWLLMADGQYRDSDVISHSGGVTGSFGRSRTGAELIYQDADRAVDLEWYRYEHSFAGAVAGTDRSYGNTQDLILSGFRQWQLSDKYAGQIIYGLELAAEESIGLEEGFRWGLGGALRWQPDAETDVALGLMFQDRFENSILPVPYVKAFWRPCRYAEVELRATGLQNGVIFRGFPTGDRATTVDLLVAYETLNFRLADAAYGSRAVVVGEVPIRLGVTQFLESSGTWFVRAQLEWVAFARHSFKHDGETQGAFQPGATWGAGARVGARF
jgi:hypothetical protein